jgi:hypothetical protein
VAPGTIAADLEARPRRASSELRVGTVFAAVDHLGRAIADLAALGFVVVWGDEPSVARHGTIAFDGGPSLTLVAGDGPAVPRCVGARRGWFGGGEGLCDVALAVPASRLHHVVRRARRAGIDIGDPAPWLRGTLVARPLDPTLPLLVSATTTRPAPAHHNGTRRIASVTVGATDPVRVVEGLAALVDGCPDDVGLDVVPADVDGVQSIVFEHPTGTHLPPRLLHGISSRVLVGGP